ncbi:hypothetical protein R6G99_03930, partial [Actinotignum timonense]|nr:hypothetical protein [Actinotignum timonense]
MVAAPFDDSSSGWAWTQRRRRSSIILLLPQLVLFRSWCWPELGEPWQVSKLYYDANLSFTRLTTLHEAILAAGRTSPFTEWLKEAAQFPRPRPGRNYRRGGPHPGS